VIIFTKKTLRKGVIMEQDKKCKNCKFYKSYFVIKDARLKVIGGFCDNDFVHPNVTKIKYSPKLCDKWQPQQNRVEVWRDDINHILKDIRKSLADITLILKDDEN
jgi:hypothetical protein